MSLDAARREMIDKIRRLPAEMEALVRDLDYDTLITHHLDTEWSVQQIVHHVADSHMNSFIRLRLVLTEDHPPLKPYDQDKWAELPDTPAIPIEASLSILRGLHARWVVLFESLTDEQWTRKGYHPDNGDMTPDDMLRNYADHGEIHLDQIRRVLAAR